MIKQIIKVELSPTEFEELQDNYVECSLFLYGYRTIFTFGRYKDNLIILEEGGTNYIAYNILTCKEAEAILSRIFADFEELAYEDYYSVSIKEKIEDYYSYYSCIEEILQEEFTEIKIGE